jgi:hypothetical protein
MSIEASQSSVVAAYKEFSSTWSASEAYWNDAKRQELHTLYVGPLDSKLTTACDAMNEIARLIERVRRDCE